MLVDIVDVPALSVPDLDANQDGKDERTAPRRNDRVIIRTDIPDDACASDEA